MSHILFPVEESRLNPSNSRYKPTEIPRQLFYIIRATTDAIDALELFLGLIFEPCCLDDKKRPIGFLAFDAHVGDTACQLRACMLLELTKHFRRPRSSTYAIAIRCIISDLKRVLEDSHQLLGALLDLDWNKIRSGGLDALGMPKTGMTMNELLLKLGWTGINIPLFGYNSHSASSQESLASITSDRFGTMSTGSLDSLRPETADDLYGELCEPPELGHVVRFLVYCYVLSNYKQLVATNEVYRATLKPEHAIKVAQNLVKREIGKQFVRPNKRAIEEEFLVLQRHISDWSCTWLESRARRLRTIQPQLHSLLKSSFRKSNKGIRSASSYAGYLVLRSLWAESSTPIIIMTTRFCPSGFHTNYFRAALKVPHCDRESPEHHHLAKVSWDLTRITGQELSYLHQSMEPHIFVGTNSLDGNTSDYLSQLPSAHRHTNRKCVDNEMHCTDMLGSDQDRVVQAIFADHRHYAFELSGEEALLGEGPVVRGLMDTAIPWLSALWETSKSETVYLGTGSSLKLCMWQHVALELPSRFLMRVEGSDRPWVISDPISRH